MRHHIPHAASVACPVDDSRILRGAGFRRRGEKTPADGDTFDQGTVLHDAEAFFGKGAEGLAKVIERAFKENGRPVGYIRAQEAAGAITVDVWRDAPGLKGIASGSRPRLAAYLSSERRIPFNRHGIFRPYPELDRPVKNPKKT